MQFCFNDRECGNATIFPCIFAKPHFLVLALLG